ncbi:MAG: DUF4266 domain-containing protein, partial [Pseudohongiellaceae bacterium]
MKRSAQLLLIGSIAFLQACSPVQAWERGYLARPEMAIDADPLEASLDAHIFFSKEASSGGNSA